MKIKEVNEKAIESFDPRKLKGGELFFWHKDLCVKVEGSELSVKAVRLGDGATLGLSSAVSAYSTADGVYEIQNAKEGS